MIVKSTDSEATLGVWPTGTPGTVRVTTYYAAHGTYDAAELIAAIQEEAK